MAVLFTSCRLHRGAILARGDPVPGLHPGLNLRDLTLDQGPRDLLPDLGDLLPDLGDPLPDLGDPVLDLGDPVLDLEDPGPCLDPCLALGGPTPELNLGDPGPELGDLVPDHDPLRKQDLGDPAPEPDQREPGQKTPDHQQGKYDYNLSLIHI